MLYNYYFSRNPSRVCPFVRSFVRSPLNARRRRRRPDSLLLNATHPDAECHPLAVAAVGSRRRNALCKQPESNTDWLQACCIRCRIAVIIIIISESEQDGNELGDLWLWRLLVCKYISTITGYFLTSWHISLNKNGQRWVLICPTSFLPRLFHLWGGWFFVIHRATD